MHVVAYVVNTKKHWYEACYCIHASMYKEILSHLYFCISHPKPYPLSLHIINGQIYNWTIFLLSYYNDSGTKPQRFLGELDEIFNMLYINVLSADKLQVTTLKGILGEEIELVVRVQAFPKASKWLKTLENVMKNTMAMTLQACVQTRVEEGKGRDIMEIILFSKNKF